MRSIFRMAVLASTLGVAHSLGYSQVTETGYFLAVNQGNFLPAGNTLNLFRTAADLGRTRFISAGRIKYTTDALVRPLPATHVSKGFFGPCVSLATGPLGGQIDYVGLGFNFVNYDQGSVPAGRPFGTYNRHSVSVYEVVDANGNHMFDPGEALMPLYTNILNPMFGPSVRGTATDFAYTYTGRSESVRRWALAPDKVFLLTAQYTTYVTRTNRSADETYYDLFAPNGLSFIYRTR